MSRTLTCGICGQHRWDNQEECDCGYDDSLESEYERYELRDCQCGCAECRMKQQLEGE